MAGASSSSSSSSSSPFFSVFLVLLVLALSLETKAQTTNSAPAPDSSSGPANLTAILAKSGQYTTFLRLMKDNQVDTQLSNQLNTSSNGLTVLAPTDNAFNNLKAGALNGLTRQEQVELLLYHIVPQFYSFTDLQTVSNPVNTQATGSGGVWGLNFTSQNNQVNVSSGLVETQIYNPLRQDRPLAVYQVDNVLLPEELFGTAASSPKLAPAPPAAKPSGASKSNSAETAKEPSASEENSGSGRRSLGLRAVVGLGLLCVGALFS